MKGPRHSTLNWINYLVSSYFIHLVYIYTTQKENLRYIAHSLTWCWHFRLRIANMVYWCCSMLLVQGSWYLLKLCNLWHFVLTSHTIYWCIFTISGIYFSPIVYVKDAIFACLIVYTSQMHLCITFCFVMTIGNDVNFIRWIYFICSRFLPLLWHHFNGAPYWGIYSII